MTDRDIVLNLLRAARVHVAVPRPEGEAAPTPATHSPEECVARFALEAQALGVECYVEPDAAAVRERLRVLTGGERVLSWDSDQLPYDAGQVLTAPLTSRDTRDRQADATVGVTGCDAAIANTGSVVMFSAPGRSRAISLLPPTHIVLVGRAQLCFTMGEMLSRYRAPLLASAGCVIITGPSRTADIELTLTLGIHGPGRVVAIVGP